ncbi:MAG: cupin domain-containing protein [Chloroflexi bacterium]|nr:cupin domain-containing protein [Chloroflexota bacterium]
MQIARFDKATAILAHNNTILAAPVLPEGMPAPFSHAWGYVEAEGALEGHAHPTVEAYFIHLGEGEITVGDETAAVSAGDLVVIPSGAYHALRNITNEPLQWFALWWPEA